MIDTSKPSAKDEDMEKPETVDEAPMAVVGDAKEVEAANELEF